MNAKRGEHTPLAGIQTAGYLSTQTVGFREVSLFQAFTLLHAFSEPLCFVTIQLFVSATHR